MSIESRLRRGDKVEDVRRLFPHNGDEIDRIVNDIGAKPKKKPGRPPLNKSNR